jgi:DNA modification methylase
MSRIEKIGNATLYLGDCLDILPTLPKVNLVLTDPPYGIGRDGQIKTTGGNGGRKAYEFLGWDGERPDPYIFDLMLEKGEVHIICGGNYFADLLPPSMRWLVWDKGQRINQSDGELAWTSMQQALRICTMNRVELMTDGAEHPTQKPVRLMNWCINLAPKTTLTVADPFMGSGTTGVACANLGKTFYGIEREQKYFDIACQRIENAYRQSRLFA